ncbi:Chitinase 10 [Hordeum vulgare]|uniref:chitinase n=1 Tax=Hordeum vulgare subsp. vulgare TaxID=112509 RepID=A0A8I6WR98_HORVV|nr:chitinase 10-like [Hordeum vulgare subsp. vulgare]KAE8807254.1 Chitinase 10 [Hordeum vulgare]
MARLFLPPVLLAFSLAAATLILNAGVAEAFSCQWQGWGGWRHVFRGRYGRRQNISSIVTEEMFSRMFLHKDDAACPANGFYNYSSFVSAAEWFPEFGSGAHHVDADTRKREVAAFLAQISHETTGGWATAPDGPYSWGLCFKEEINASSNYCDADNKEWPCVDGKSYHGRGPMQLSWNYNYGPAGEALCFDGLGNPEVVASDPDVAFKAALWFWMTPQEPKPSCHDVMLGRYVPTEADKQANRTAGFGLTTNIINGGLECNRTGDPRVEDRIGYYRRYCEILKVDDLGDNLDCAQQLPYS